jgi:hypothetical protein
VILMATIAATPPSTQCPAGPYPDGCQGEEPWPALLCSSLPVFLFSFAPVHERPLNPSTPSTLLISDTSCHTCRSSPCPRARPLPLAASLPCTSLVSPSPVQSFSPSPYGSASTFIAKGPSKNGRPAWVLPFSLSVVWSRMETHIRKKTSTRPSWLFCIHQPSPD